jgi:iron complex outermembrane recepter protein
MKSKRGSVGIVPLCAGMMLAASAAAEQTGSIEEVVVTGSYIKRSNFNSPSPVDFLSQEDFAKAGAISVKDIVQNLPYNIGSENFPDTARSGATTGMESINLRGLGLNSTLVLVNGRRQAEAPQLNNDGIAFVDTASIVPTIAVERMEILKDGASALYGSDAISGVVNFITRNNYEGFELSYDYQTITDYNQDRPRDTVLQAIAGFGDDRGHLVMAGSWLQRNRMPFHERDFTTGTGISSTGSPGTFNPVRNPLLETAEEFNARRLAFRSTTFLPNKVTATGALAYQGADLDCQNVPHAKGRTPTSFLQATGVPGALPGAEACLFDFFPTQSMLDEERRLQLWSHFDYMLVPEHDVQVYGEIQTASNTIDRGNSTSYGFVIQPAVPIENPGLRNDFVRRGLAPEAIINDAAAQAAGFTNAIAAARALAADPFALGETPSYIGPMLFQGRPFTDVPERYTQGESIFDNTGKMNRDKTHVVLGLNGNLPFAEGWTFDLSNTWSQHKFDGFAAYDTNDPKMRLALAGLGGRDCDTVNGTPGVGPCYFFNPYGSNYLAPETSVGPNGLFNTAEVFKGMFDPLLGNTTQELWVVDAVVTGDLFELPAGAVGMAFGAQYRDQSFDSETSGTGKNFDFSFVVGGEPFSVSRDVYAVFAEFLVPITDESSPIGALELSTAVRYEDYGGGTGDTTDPKFALLWTPTDSLAVRGTWQTSFKAPGLAQLGGSSTSLNNVPSNPFVAGSPNQFVPGIATGNPNLTPETAEVWNVGFTWEPDFALVEGLSISVDHWSFAFEDAIRKEANATVTAECVAEAATSGGALTGPKCSKITFNADNTIAVIRSNFVNAATVDTRGIDLVVRYPLPFEQFGQVAWFWNSSHITHYEFQESPTALKIDGLGHRNFQTIGAPAPKMRGNTGFDWLMGNHSANLTVRYVHDYDLGYRQGVVGGVPTLVPVQPNATIALLNNRTPSREIDSQVTVDVQYSYQMAEILGRPGPTFTLGLINAFDEDPPYVDDGPGYDTKIHDPRGRILYGRVALSF